MNANNVQPTRRSVELPPVILEVNLPENLKLYEHCLELIDDEIKHIRSTYIVRRSTIDKWAKVADLLFQAAKLLGLTVIEYYDQT